QRGTADCLHLRLHDQRGTLLGQDVGGLDPGDRPGVHRRLDSATLVSPRPDHGRGEIGRIPRLWSGGSAGPTVVGATPLQTELTRKALTYNEDRWRKTVATLGETKPSNSSPILRLDQTNLGVIGTRIPVPTYPRERLAPAIVHIGVGGFHRAHQAVYLDELAERRVTDQW